MRGDGRIFQRKESSIFWCSFYRNGKEHRESTGHTDEKKAEKYLRNRVNDARTSEKHPEIKFQDNRVRRLTIADLMDALKTDFELRGKASPQNLSNVKRVREDFGEIRALALTASKIAEYVKNRQNDGDAKASINRTTQLLKQAYVLAELPAPKMVRLDESDNVRRGFFVEPEIRRVISALSPDLGDFVTFGWLTGMRKGEIASLLWKDVDGDVLTLRGEDAKNGEPRTVPLIGELAELIARRRAARALKLKGTVMVSDLIFHREGQPIREFRKSWATACKIAGLRGRLFHDLRRSAARDLTRSGVPQTVAMSITGHKTASMFQRYNITDLSDQKRALEKNAEYRKTVASNVAVASTTVN